MANWKTPADLKYQKTDEWVRVEGDTATVGVSDYAQDALNDLVFIEYSVTAGATVKKGDVFAAVESVKAQSDIVTPVSGTVIAVNHDLEKTPEKINSDPYGDAWMLKIKLSSPADTADLMDAAAYDAFCMTR